MSSVVTMIVISDRTQADGTRSVRYKFDLLDNLNANHIEYIGPKFVPADFDTDADMIALAPVVLAIRAEHEQQEAQEGSRNGLYVLHDDMGGWYQKKTMAWGTWDEQAIAWLKYWLAFEDQLELVNMQLDLAVFSGQDLRNLLDITNQNVTNIRGAMQIAIDTKLVLDTYVPFFDDDGNFVSA